jgi:E3 ubiquitin-protein ligase DOA10
VPRFALPLFVPGGKINNVAAWLFVPGGKINNVAAWLFVPVGKLLMYSNIKS